jgi:hypothetical protein
MANGWLFKPLVPASVTALGSVVLGDPSNVLNDYAGIVCQLNCDNSNSASLVVDLGQNQMIDTVMAFGVDLIPAGTPVMVDWASKAQGAFTGSFSSDKSQTAYTGTTAMTSGKGVTLLALAAPVQARYVRLTYAPVASGQAVRIARLAIGQRLKLERNFSYGAVMGVRDLGSLDFSARGVLLRRRAAKLRTVTLTFSNVRKDEVEASVKPLLEQVGNTEMVALVTDPAENVQRQNRCYFGPLVGDLEQTWRNPAAWEVKANVVSLF